MRCRVIDPVKVLKLFGGKAGYQRLLRDGLAEGHKNNYYEVEDQRFPGEQGFGEKVHGREGRTHKAAPKRSMESIVRQLTKELKVNGEAAGVGIGAGRYRRRAPSSLTCSRGGWVTDWEKSPLTFTWTWRRWELWFQRWCQRCGKDGSPTVVDCCFPPLLTVGHFKDHSAEPLSAITGWGSVV